jgi:hypothetical protein
MGEAKRRQAAQFGRGPVVYHHTSTLRTNLIWMSGLIEVEGKTPPVCHPHLGEIRTDALARRALKDFPPLAWFTTQIDIPKCLRQNSLFFIDNTTGKVRHEETAGRNISDALALHRLAIGFPVLGSMMPWPDHLGFSTPEGRDLNDSAREAGDDPRHWFVSEEPIDVLQSVEIWSSRSILNPKLERWDWYLKDVHNMVRNCRQQGVYIPPTWLSAEQAQALARKVGLPAISGAAKD